MQRAGGVHSCLPACRQTLRTPSLLVSLLNFAPRRHETRGQRLHSMAGSSIAGGAAARTSPRPQLLSVAPM